MSIRSPVPVFRFLFRAATVIAAIATALFGNLAVAGGAVVMLVFSAAGLTYYEVRELRIQPRSEELVSVLEEDILPRLLEEYDGEFENPLEVRANVMFMRRRHLRFWRAARFVLPWEKTMKIEASVGDYETTRETSLLWKRGEGVVGKAIESKANEMWPNQDLSRHQGTDVQTQWDLTDSQYTRTDQLTSLLCVPIYLPSDVDNEHPIGTLNIDSEAPFADTRLNQEEIAELVSYYANLIGTIVD